MAAKFEIDKSKNDKFYFRLKAGNGEPILGSEIYESKASAKGGIDSVKKNAPDDARYQKKTASSGEHYFVLTATNGEPIGKSEMYSSASSRDGGIESVKRNAPSADVVDLT